MFTASRIERRFSCSSQIRWGITILKSGMPPLFQEEHRYQNSSKMVMAANSFKNPDSKQLKNARKSIQLLNQN